jgi:tRNA(fMet)-specific endonuclease VapC
VRILDTDVCIEILRDNRQVKARRRSVKDRVVTTWITAGELYYGAYKSAKPRENRRLVAEFLRTLDVLGLDTAAVEQFGRLRASLESQGQRLEDADLFIAGIVLANGGTLVSGNRQHYARIPGLKLEDWIRRAAGP